MLDVIVIGAGPAGLTAAQVLGRQGRATLVADSGRPRNAASPALHMFPSRDGVAPADLRSHARDELAAYPSVQVADARVTAARGEIDGFEVELDHGERYQARRLLLATGVTDQLPDIDGFAERFGTGVFHCPFCHGNEVRGKTVAVLGNGLPGAAMALYLRDRFSDDVVLLTDGQAELPEAAAVLVKERGILVREAAVTRIEGEPDALTVRFGEGEPMARQALFHRPAERQHSTLAVDLGCEILSDGWVKVDAQQCTTVPGVYAAGDLARVESLRVALTFALAGAAAGQAAAVWLDGELFRADHPTLFPAAPS